MLFHHTINLIKKEILLEWRNKYALNGIVLYLSSTIFICYMSFNIKAGLIEPATWNALFWIIILFSAVNAVAKSFIQERYGRFIYYYILASPQAIILSKIIYNSLLLIIMSTIGFIFYSIVLGNPVEDVPLFLLVLFLASTGFSASLTMISGIASKAANSNTLMVILGFPIIIPLLLMVIRLSTNSIEGVEFDTSFNDLLTLIAINIIAATVAWLLFPFLWKS
jgi:heme exporter protein B